MAVILFGGTIGVGKTSLMETMQKEMGGIPQWELKDDPELDGMLAQFYKDRERFMFPLQIFFMNKRFRDIKKASLESNNGHLIWNDRSIYEDEVIFKLNVEQAKEDHTSELNIYHNLLNNMIEEVPEWNKEHKSPNLMIWIKGSYDTVIQRIRHRGRDFEQIEQDPTLVKYYQDLIEMYNTWYENYNKSPKIMIDGDKYDFMNNMDDRKEVINQIKSEMHDLGLKDEYGNLI